MNKYTTMAKNIKPPRMWIDGQCFNIITSGKRRKLNPIDSKELPECDYTREYSITSSEEGTFSTIFKLPKIYYVKLYNFNSISIKDIAQNTNTEINVPKHGIEGHISIIGNNIQNIIDARHTLHEAVYNIRNRITAAQFISIPVVNNDIIQNFEKFKSEILESSPIEGMHESIFQSGLKLHLTVTVFSLFETEKEEAIKVLEDYKTEVFMPLLKKHGPLKIKISGIDCMNDNYTKTNVLYANAELINSNNEISLQKIADDLADYFYQRGLAKEMKENVKLHVTLINTKYRKVPQTSGKRSWKDKKIPFNATSIIEKYKDFYFGEVILDQIHLSLISSKGEDGFYKPLSVIKYDDY